MLVIVNYGLGNIKAFANVYKKLGIPFKIASRPEELKEADKILLPGVGAFDSAMELLEKSKMREPLGQLVLQNYVPILGVCVGMQIMAQSSEEGKLTGLGWINGRVKKFDSSLLVYKNHLPHMGWNDIKPIGENKLFQNINEGARFYFLHSYYFQCQDEKNIIALTNYGIDFPAAINSKNIYGVQFHPEKSHHHGTTLLKNFANL